MALKVGELFALLELRDQGFHTGLNRAEMSFGNLRSIAASALFGVTAAIGAASAAVVKMGIDFNANMEQSNIAWTTLLGTAEKAKKMQQDLLTMGALTPFEFEDLDKSAKTLKALGFEGNQIIPMLRTVGDSVSAIGGGAEALQGVTLAIGQMNTKGKISAQEMNQLAERGIGAWDILSQKMGKSTQELMKMGENGELFAKDVIPLLIEGLNEKFAGAMDKQSKTWNGMWSTIKDNTKIIFGEITDGMFESMKARLPKILDLMNKFTVDLKKSGLSEAIKNLFPPEVSSNAVKVFKDISTKIKPILDNLKVIFSQVVEAITLLWERFGPTIIQIFKYSWNMVVSILENVTKIIRGVLDFFIGGFTGDWRRMSKGAQEIWSGLWNGIKVITDGAWNILKAAFNGIYEAIAAWFKNLARMAKRWAMDMLYGMAEGLATWGTSVGKSLNNLNEGIQNKVTIFFGIKSPSKLMARYGKNIVEGLANGILEAKDKAVEPLTVALDIIKAKFDLFMAQLPITASESQKLTAQLDFLNKELTVQKSVVDVAKKAYEDMAAIKGKAALETQKLYLELLKETQAQVDLSKAIAEANRVRKEEATFTSAEAVTRRFKNGEASITDVQLAWINQNGGQVGWDGKGFYNSKPNVNMNVNITSPSPLSPSGIRTNLEQMSRKLALEWS